MSKLFFDRQLIAGIKKANTSKEYLYALLHAGKITLPEYLLAIKQ